VLVLLFLLAPGQPSGAPGSSSTSTTAGQHHPATLRDPEGTAIRQLAASLRSNGLPGDTALASSLEATAAAKPGVARETAAEEALTLAGVLYAGGGISGTQFQDVASVLQPTGAAVPTTTVPTTVPAPAPKGPGPGDKHGHGGGDQGGG